MKDARLTVAELWHDFYDQVLAPEGIEVGSIQQREMRKAFYSGVMRTLIMLNDLAGDESLNEDQQAAHLSSMMDEIKAFFTMLVREWDARKR
jgi:hypothetical protein